MTEAAEPRLDRLLAGRLLLRQPAGGHRAGTDAVLLAAAAPVEAGDHVLDVGSGVGTVGLALAIREAACVVTLLEREPLYAGLARENIELNGVSDRVSVEEADLFGAQVEQASLLVSNPPFLLEQTTRTSADPMKARAHTLDGTTHGGWLSAMLRFARPHARFVVIHRPEAMPELLDAAARRCGALKIIPVLPQAGADAIRILFGGVVGSRAPLAIGPPLLLHDNNRFTEEAAALHSGSGTLELLPRQTRKSRPRGPASSISG